MSENLNNEEVPEHFDAGDQRRVVEFMAKAGWLTGTNLVTIDSDIHLKFSKDGRLKMQALSQVLKSVAPQFFGLPPKWDLGNEIQQFRSQALTVAPELSMTNFSARESNVFMAIIAGYGLGRLDDGSGNAPPTS